MRITQKPQALFWIRLTAASLILLLMLSQGLPVLANAQADPWIPGAWVKLISNPVLATGTPGAWDDQFTFAPSVLLDGATYKMWYAGSGAASPTRKFGYATSPDGLTWTRQGSGPVFDAGPSNGWDAKIGFPSVIKDGSTYKMWYTGLNASDAGQVGYATSPDGVTWTRYPGNPVLSFGAGSSWDATYVGSPNVVKVGSLYQMWYRGGLSGGIGYATSPDGIAWTKYSGNPVIARGSGGWDHTAYHPRVIYAGAGYHMWYSGCDPAGNLCQMGYATSPDGAQWTRQGLVLPQGAAGAWDRGGADHAAVALVGTTLKMWYSGFDGTFYRIGYASTTANSLGQKLFLPMAIR
jgi:predicted GH43/DUF377 family glycosyl hydrolase